MPLARTWNELDDTAARTIVKTIRERLPDPPNFLDPTTAAGRFAPLSFYDSKHHLLELTFGERATLIIWDGSDEFIPVDFKSATIHALNARVPIRLSVPDPQEASRRVVDYALFFTGLLGGSAGENEESDRFDIIEHLDEIEWNDPHSPRPQVRIESIRVDPRGEDGRWRVYAHMLFGRTIFAASLIIREDGFVEMDADSPEYENLPVTKRTYEILPREIRSDPKRGPKRINVDRLLELAATGRFAEQYTVSEEVDLSHREIAQPFLVENVIFARGLKLDGARFLRNVRIWNCAIAETIEARGVRVEGSFEIFNTPVGTGLRQTAVSRPVAIELSLARIEGALSIQHVAANGDIDLSSATVDSWAMIRNCSIAGGLQMGFARFDSFTFSRDVASLIAPVPDATGLVDFGGCECRAEFKLEGLWVAGLVVARGATVGSLAIQGDELDVTTEAGVRRQRRPLKAAGIGLVGCHVRERLQVKAVSIERSDANDAVWGAVKESIVIEGCRVGADLRLCGEVANVLREYADEGSLGNMTFVQRDVKLSGTRIESELDLRDLVVRRRLDLSEVRVDRATRCDATGGRQIECDDAVLPDGTEVRRARTYCAEFIATGAHFTGGLALSGLSCSGSVNLSRAIIDGPLDFHATPTQARIEGNLNLSGVTADSLRISGACMPMTQQKSAIAERERVKLDDAKIRRIELVETPLTTGGERVRLNGLKVSHWEFPGRENPETQLEVFEQLLRADQHKLRGSFASIERSLLEQGHAEEAEQIRKFMFRSMRSASGWESDRDSRRRARWLGVPRFLRNRSYHFWEWFGYGRHWSLLVLFALNLALGAAVFWQASSVAPSFDALDAGAALQADRLTIMKPYESPTHVYTTADPWWMALRTQVPFLSVVIREDFRPSPYRSIAPWLPVTPQGYAQIVALVYWVWWPLFLLSATGIVRRAGLRE